MGEGAILGRMITEGFSKNSHFKGKLNDVYYHEAVDAEGAESTISWGGNKGTERSGGWSAVNYSIQVPPLRAMQFNWKP